MKIKLALGAILAALMLSACGGGGDATTETAPAPEATPPADAAPPADTMPTEDPNAMPADPNAPAETPPAETPPPQG